MQTRKRTVKELKELLPEDAVHAAFLERADIKDLPKEEQEERWAQQKEDIDSFLGWISKMPSSII